MSGEKSENPVGGSTFSDEQIASFCKDTAVSNSYERIIFVNFSEDLCRTVFSTKRITLPDNYEQMTAEISKRIMGIEKLKFLKNADRENIKKKLAERDKFTFEIKNLYMNDSIRYFSVTAAAFPDADVTACLFLVKDITDEYTEKQSTALQIGRLGAAAASVYSTVFSVNITKNEFVSIEFSDFRVSNVSVRGVYDDFVTQTAQPVHPGFQSRFREVFDKDAVLKAYADGEKEIVLKYLSLSGSEDYRFKESHLIFVDNAYNTDIIAVFMTLDTDDKMTALNDQDTLLAGLEMLFDGVIVVNLTRKKFKYMNSRLKDKKLSGSFSDEMIERFGRENVASNDADRFIEDNLSDALLKKISDTDGTFENSYLFRNPVTKEYQVYGASYKGYVDDMTGDVKLVMGLKNIDRQKALETEQESSLERFGCAVRGLYLRIYEFDSDTGDLMVYDPSDTEGDLIWKKKDGPWEDYLQSEELSLVNPRYKEEFRTFITDSLSKAEQSYKENKLPLEFTYLRRSGNDGFKWVTAVINAFTVKGRIRYALYIKDCDAQQNEKRRLIKQLRAANETAQTAGNARSDFISHMSHDIRTPMNVITGMTDVALRSSGDNEKVHDCLEKIEGSSKVLMGLLNDILDMSAIQSGTLRLAEEPFSMSALLSSVISASRYAADEKKQTFTADIRQFSDDVLTGDKIRIKQVLMNLITNAVKFSSQNTGTVSLRAKQYPGKESGRAVFEFVIEDNGIGMSKDYMNRVFTPFEKAPLPPDNNEQGTGLGLPISKNILDLMDGTIDIDSKLGEGTKITVKIPIETYDGPFVPESDGVVKDSASASSDVPDMTGRRVLIVEDQPVNIEVMRQVLNLTGCSSDEAFNGQSAVNIIKNAPDGFYDMIFMDIQMPVMDGYEATSQIRAMDRKWCRNVPIISMSANAFSQDQELAKMSGMDECIIKPVNVSEVFRILKRFIRYSN